MIDRNLLMTLEEHPASKLAQECMKKLKLPRSSMVTSLLDLLVNWLDSQPEKAFSGRNNYLDDLQTEARLLTTQPQPAAVALLTNDYETMQNELAANPAQAASILEDHLSQLLRSMEECESVGEAAKLLADNLESNLRLQSLASDPPSP